MRHWLIALGIVATVVGAVASVYAPIDGDTLWKTLMTIGVISLIYIQWQNHTERERTT
jgi:hypothetical protein